MTRAVTVLFVTGYCATSCFASTLTAACARARLTPGFRYPIACRSCSSRFVVNVVYSSIGFIDSGT